jgi:hypothetical protein
MSKEPFTIEYRDFANYRDRDRALLITEACLNDKMKAWFSEKVKQALPAIYEAIAWVDQMEVKHENRLSSVEAVIALGPESPPNEDLASVLIRLRSPLVSIELKEGMDGDTLGYIQLPDVKCVSLEQAKADDDVVLRFLKGERGGKWRTLRGEDEKKR